MSTRDDGGPAFPWGEHGDQLGGMTLRDYFAAAAIAAAEQWERFSPTYDGPLSYKGIAERAYLMADAMIKERAK